MKNFCSGLFIFLVFSGCSSIRVIKYQKLPDDVYANNNLVKYFQDNKSPKIVLRVPGPNEKGNDNASLSSSASAAALNNPANVQNDNVAYNAIEKELLKEGFSVRDRKLFNGIMDKTKSTDYSKIGEETDTDLILEIISINPNVTYSTKNVTVISGGKSSSEVEISDYKRSGASIEFRMILVRTNEVAGTYKYNYNPCPEGGCPVTDWVYNKTTKQLELKDSVAVNALEDFVTQCTKDLIKSVKS